MKVVAILAVRNGEHYIANALRHLIANDIHYAVFDNMSDDRTREIVIQDRFSSHLF
jgi:glycosyltransferase involved in cell wall biosynthesis